MSECSLIEENGRAHFLTKRFDRKDGKKIHMQTLCGMAHFDYRLHLAYNPNGGWTATHQMSVNGKFDDITRQDLLEFALQNNIKDASHIIDEICETTSLWPQMAKECDVPKEMIAPIVSNMLLMNKK